MKRVFAKKKSEIRKISKLTGKSENMQIRRPGTKGYEEVDGSVNITSPPNQNAPNGVHGDTTASHLAPEFELASVSVVPDGE